MAEVEEEVEGMEGLAKGEPTADMAAQTSKRREGVTLSALVDV